MQAAREGGREVLYKVTDSGQGTPGHLLGGETRVYVLVLSIKVCDREREKLKC